MLPSALSSQLLRLFQDGDPTATSRGPVPEHKRSPCEEVFPFPTGISLPCACWLSALHWAPLTSLAPSSACLQWNMVIRSFFSLLVSGTKTTWLHQPFLCQLSFQIFLHFSCLENLHSLRVAPQSQKLSHPVSRNPTTS